MGKTRTPNSTTGVTLDTGALIALDRGERRMITLLDQALTARKTFRIPAGVVGEVWRDGRIQATLARFLKAPEVEIVRLMSTSPDRAENFAAPPYIRCYRCVGCDRRQRTQ